MSKNFTLNVPVDFPSLYFLEHINFTEIYSNIPDQLEKGIVDVQVTYDELFQEIEDIPDSPNISYAGIIQTRECRIMTKINSPESDFKDAMAWFKINSQPIILFVILLLVTCCTLSLLDNQNHVHLSKKIFTYAFILLDKAFFCLNQRSHNRKSLLRIGLLISILFLWLSILNFGYSFTHISQAHQIVKIDNLEKLRSESCDIIGITKECDAAVKTILHDFQDFFREKQGLDGINLVQEMISSEPGKAILIGNSDLENHGKRSCSYEKYPDYYKLLVEIYFSQPVYEMRLPLLYSKTLDARKKRFLLQVGYSLLEQGHYNYQRRKANSKHFKLGYLKCNCNSFAQTYFSQFFRTSQFFFSIAAIYRVVLKFIGAYHFTFVIFMLILKYLAYKRNDNVIEPI